MAAQVTHSGVMVTAGTRVVFVASFNLLPWAPGSARGAAELLIGNRPNPQEEGRTEARTEARAEARAEATTQEAPVDAAAKVAPASLAKPPVSVFSAPRSGGSIFGNRSTVRSSAANAAPSSIFSGGTRQRQASKVSVMQALPTDLSIEERVLEMQVEYVLEESGEGMLQR